jgi:hypothetical protein
MCVCVYVRVCVCVCVCEGERERGEREPRDGVNMRERRERERGEADGIRHTSRQFKTTDPKRPPARPAHPRVLLVLPNFFLCFPLIFFFALRPTLCACVWVCVRACCACVSLTNTSAGLVADAVAVGGRERQPDGRGGDVERVGCPGGTAARARAIRVRGARAYRRQSVHLALGGRGGGAGLGHVRRWNSADADDRR